MKILISVKTFSELLDKEKQSFQISILVKWSKKRQKTYLLRLDLREGNPFVRKMLSRYGRAKYFKSKVSLKQG